MKKLLTTIGLAALLAGCTTTQTGQKTVDPQALAIVAQEAAAMGSVYWLQSHPQDRDKFELARKSLRILVNTGSGSIADLQTAIASLPIKQLQGSQGAVVVTGAVVLLDAAGKQLLTLDKQQVWSTYVLPVASGLLAGLDQALGTTQAGLDATLTRGWTTLEIKPGVTYGTETAEMKPGISAGGGTVDCTLLGHLTAEQAAFLHKQSVYPIGTNP